MADKAYMKFGVEEEQYQKAVAHYNIFEDAEIKQIMQHNMQNLSPDLMQMVINQMGESQSNS